MAQLRSEAYAYSTNDVYNMDETDLFWKATPSRGLASRNIPGVKDEKSRITLVVCCSASSSDKLPLWVIGKAKTPHALRNISTRAIGIEWRHNSKAWMNQFIMNEWLEAFFHHIGPTWKIVLLMDNFSAHKTPLQNKIPSSSIKIIWSPPNSMSVFQPLDQGIIASLKFNYKRRWLAFMLEKFEANQDPVKSMNVRISIRWAVESWREGVAAQGILNCFCKSTVIDANQLAPIAEPHPAIEIAASLLLLYKQVNQAGAIHDAMDIQSWLNLIEEIVVDDLPSDYTEDNILDDLITQYTAVSDYDESDVGISRLQVPPTPTAIQTLNAISVLVDYIETGKIGTNCDHISTVLAKLRRDVERISIGEK